MMIDRWYKNVDKGNFYLGMISEVNRNHSIIQVENLSILKHRKLLNESLLPHTVNYFVIIDNVQGIFLGEVFQTKLNGSESIHDTLNKVYGKNSYPEISINIIGLMESNSKTFSLAGFRTVGITDKVYVANESVVEAYLDSIEIGFNSESKLESFADFSNFDKGEIALKPSTLFNRHLMAIGTTNSGKSTSALTLLDRLVKEKIKVLLIDPTGEYKSSFTSNEMKELTLGVDTVLSVGEISMAQWSMLFATNENTQPVVLEKAIRSLRYQKKNGKSVPYTKNGKKVADVKSELDTLESSDVNFDIHLLPEQINEESVKEEANYGTVTGKYDRDASSAVFNSYLQQKVDYYLKSTSILKFFGTKQDDRYELIEELGNFFENSATSLYIDASGIGTQDGIGSMIVDLISNHCIEKKISKKNAFVFFVDEIHRYIKPKHTDISYQSGMISIAREGRKKGIFLFLTTQSPKDVPDILLSQVGTLLIHRLTNSEEIMSIQNHLSHKSRSQIGHLNQGESILTSINLLQEIHLRFKKAGRTHDNETPILK